MSNLVGLNPIDRTTCLNLGVAQTITINPYQNGTTFIVTKVATFAQTINIPSPTIGGLRYKFILFNTAAEINFTIPVCKNSSFTISSLNPADGQFGPAVQWEAAETVDVHTSMACDQAKNEYLSLVVAGDKKMYWNLTSEMQGGRLIIGDDSAEPDLDLKVYVEGLAEGIYADDMLNISFEDMNLGTRGYSLYCPTATSGCGFTDFTITHFAETEGEWIRGYFEGTFWIKTFNPLTAGGLQCF